MAIFRTFFKTNIGKKFFVGIFGLGLSVFVLIHMLGNILIFVGPEAYNKYSYALTSNPLLIVAELGLLTFFLGHVFISLFLTVKNWRARPVHYTKISHGEKRTSLIQRTLWAQGIVIVVFVILHLITFKWGPHYEVSYEGVKMRDLYRLVLEVFQSPLYVVWYIAAVSLLLFHLTHGLKSALQTLGLHHPHYEGLLRRLSWGYGLLVGFGFISQPLYVFIFHQG